MSSKEFKINEYITLRLEEGITNIYVKFQLFNQCKFLLLEIPVTEITDLDDIESIDEAAERLDNSLEGNDKSTIDIPPETEFWGHCSNIQAWAENNYNSRLLHRNLAFPLLKALVDAGDPIAKRMFKEEIQKRLDSRYPCVVEFLKAEGYTDYLDIEFRGALIPIKEAEALIDIEKKLDCEFIFHQSIQIIKPNDNEFNINHLFQIFKTNLNIDIIQRTLSAIFSTRNNHVNAVAIIDQNYCEGCEKEKSFLQGKVMKADDPYFEYDFKTGKEEVCLRCGIQEYPLELQLLPFLNKLIIITNDFFTNNLINPRIKYLTTLEELYLHGCGSDSIIDDISYLQNLTTLIINNYPLSTISPSIQRLISMQTLDLKNCRITNIPDSFCNLISLETLDITGNNLSGLSDAIIEFFVSLKQAGKLIGHNNLPSLR